MRVERLVMGLMLVGGLGMGAYQLEEIHQAKTQIQQLRQQLTKDERYQKYVGSIALEDRSVLQPLRASQSLRDCIKDGLEHPKTQWDDILGNCQGKI